MTSQNDCTPEVSGSPGSTCGICSGTGGRYEHRRGHRVLGESYEWTVWVCCECQLDEHFVRRYPYIPLPNPRTTVASSGSRRMFIVAPWDNFSRWLSPVLYSSLADPTPPKVINDEHLTRAYVTESSSGGVAPLAEYAGLLVLVLGVASGNSATGEAVASAIIARDYRPIWIYSPLPLAELPGKNFKWTSLEGSLMGFNRRTLP